MKISNYLTAERGMLPRSKRLERVKCNYLVPVSQKTLGTGLQTPSRLGGDKEDPARKLVLNPLVACLASQILHSGFGLPSSRVTLAHSIAQKRTGGGAQSGSNRVAAAQFIAENTAYHASRQSLMRAWIS